MKSFCIFFLNLTILLLACKEPSKTRVDNLVPFETDTANINGDKYALSVFKDTSNSFFKVEKETNGQFKTILVDSDYSTNNSSVVFRDENKDNYLDIVWTKKWQDHSYLFNPRKENFFEVGEFHNVDTLLINGRQVLFKGIYPLLYLFNFEKEFEWMTELHSEIFIIDSNYQKISFATIDNFASLEDNNITKCVAAKSVVVNCYVPPYFGKYGQLCIWNSGNSIDSIFMKSYQFDSTFIANYWIKNYSKLLKYGQAFKVRREKALKYF